MEFNAEDFNINDKTEEADLNKAVFETVITGGDIDQNFEIEYEVINGKQIAYMSAMDDIGVESSDCGNDEETAVVKFTDQHWETATIEGLLVFCAKDLNPMLKILKTIKKDGLERYNIIGSEIEKVITGHIEVAIKKMMNRIYWFADRNADIIDNGGSFKNGTKLKLFTMLNGILKRLDTEVPTENAFTISENSKATTLEQLTLADGRSLEIFRKLYNTITPEMWEAHSEGKPFLIQVTPEIIKNWHDLLEDKSLAFTLNQTEEKVTNYSYRGIPIKVKHDIASNLKRYKTNGVKLDRPNIALLTFKENMPLGLTSKEAFKQLEVWYDKNSQKVKFRFSFDMGMAVIEPEKVILAR